MTAIDELGSAPPPRRTPRSDLPGVGLQIATYRQR
jgi:hypothetical protein